MASSIMAHHGKRYTHTQKRLRSSNHEQLIRPLTLGTGSGSPSGLSPKRWEWFSVNEDWGWDVWAAGFERLTAGWKAFIDRVDSQGYACFHISPYRRAVRLSICKPNNKKIACSSVCTSSKSHAHSSLNYTQWNVLSPSAAGFKACTADHCSKLDLDSSSSALTSTSPQLCFGLRLPAIVRR